MSAAYQTAMVTFTEELLDQLKAGPKVVPVTDGVGGNVVGWCHLRMEDGDLRGDIFLDAQGPCSGTDTPAFRTEGELREVRNKAIAQAAREAMAEFAIPEFAFPEYWTGQPEVANYAALKQGEPAGPPAFAVGQLVEVHGIGPDGCHELNGRRGTVAQHYTDLGLQRRRVWKYVVNLDGDDPTRNGGYFLAENLRAVKDLGVVPSGEVITLPLDGTPVSWIERRYRGLNCPPEPPADEPRAITFLEWL